MMGQQAAAQDQLFYPFNLDTHVPADHLLRRIDRVLDLSELRQHLALLQSHRTSVGRSAIDAPDADHWLLLRQSFLLLIGRSVEIRTSGPADRMHCIHPRRCTV
jgi:hypothetical protein